MATENVTLPEGSSFEMWVLREGLAITQQQLIPDILTLELEPWERTGVNATLLDLTPVPPQEKRGPEPRMEDYRSRTGASGSIGVFQRSVWRAGMSPKIVGRRPCGVPCQTEATGAL